MNFRASRSTVLQDREGRRPRVEVRGRVDKRVKTQQPSSRTWIGMRQHPAAQLSAIAVPALLREPRRRHHVQDAARTAREVRLRCILPCASPVCSRPLEVCEHLPPMRDFGAGQLPRVREERRPQRQR